MNHAARLSIAITAVLLGACGGDSGNDESGGGQSAAPVEEQKFVQTWGAAGGYATTTATLPYFPSVPNQTTGVTAPGVAVVPTQAPPANTSTGAAIFANTTVRQFVKVSIGGSQVRLRLSNAFGPAALTIDEMHVALANRAACATPTAPVAPATAARGPTCTNIVPQSDKTVTVNGSATIVIPPGQDVYSDPVSLPVSPLGDVAVSFYVRNATPPLTTHFTGFQTAYYAVGIAGTTANFVGATALDTATIGGRAALATGTTSLVVVGLDVKAPAGTRSIVAFGDSITDGTNTLLDTNTRWSNDLAQRLATQSTTNGKAQVAVSNAGIGGNKVATDNATIPFGIAGVTRFRRDALDRSGVTDVIVLEGVNDLGQAATATPADVIIAAYRNLIRQAHTANVRIYFATIAPIRSDVATANGTYDGGFSGSKALFDQREPIRLAVNDWIKSQNEADGVFDFNAALSPPGKLNQLYAPYSISFTNGSNDQLHPNATGYRVMADAIDLTLFQ